MFRKSLSMMLISSLLITLFAAPSALAKSKEEKEAEFAARVKAGVAKLGAGAETRISVKLRNKTKLSGYISRVGAESFVITDLKTGAETEVAYPDVRQAKGNNLSTGATIAIVAGVAVGVTLLVLWILYATTG
jgi:hypothetical protein